MRVGFVVDNDVNSDIRVRKELEIITGEGYDVTTLCFDFRKSYPDTSTGSKFERIRINRKIKDTLFFFLNLLPLYEFLWAQWIRDFILKNEISILHVHDLYMSKAAHKGIKKSGKKVSMILDLHENYPASITTYNWTKGFLRHLLSRPHAWAKKEKEYLNYADRIIVLSESFKNDLLSRYQKLKRENFTVFPNVPDPLKPEYHTKKNIGPLFRNNNPVIFYYGVVAERRGIFDTLEVFLRMIEEGKHANLLIVGPVDRSDSLKFKKMLENDPLSGYVYYIPWIDASDFPSYLDLSDICLAPFHKNPQHESGVANKVYDYMLGAKPVVASDCKPQKELIEDYTCGVIFQNREEFHEALIRLLENESLREEMGMRGKNAILQKFNIASLKVNLTGLYKSLSE
ncbi:MAG TPA: glycosyltransferase family 4 protein [Bacteroidales bacterium]|nr:glycosyltransferase family 4 protein [Bacteroidales bacterium]